MKTLRTLSMALTAMICFGVVSAGEIDLKLIPQSAILVTHIDFEKFMNNPPTRLIYDTLLEQPEIKKAVNTMKVILDFAIERDLKDVTLYSVGYDLLVPGDPETGTPPRKEAKEVFVKILSGNFNKDKILELVKLSDHYQSRQYGNYTMVMNTIDEVGKQNNANSAGKKKKRDWFCFTDENTAIFAETPEILMKALDVISGKTPSLAQDNTVFPKLEKYKDAIVVNSVELSRRKNTEVVTKLFTKTTSYLITSPDNHLIMESVTICSDDMTAARLARIVSGFGAMFEILFDKYMQKETYLELFSQIKVSTEGKIMKVRADYRYEMLQKIAQDATPFLQNPEMVKMLLASLFQGMKMKMQKRRP